MNTFMPRMFVLACVALSLALSGCGPKEIEPYQTPTEESAAEKSIPIAKTYPLYSTSNLGDDQKGILGSIEEEDMPSSEEEEESASLTIETASLAEDLPLPENDDNTPIVETLDAGSGAGEQKLGFGTLDHKSAAYKEEHGRSSLQMKPVYFDFDQSTIRRDQIPHLEHNAEYLRSNPARKVLIEGNCDEQGTNEYNLALGERRAMNARNYMIKLGINGSRMRTVSYGEERPLFTGSEQSDYAYNRRDDFILE